MGRSGWRYVARLWLCIAVCSASLIGVLLTESASAATPGSAYSSVANFGSGDLFALGGPYGGTAIEPGTGNIVVTDQVYGVQVFAPDALVGGTLLTSFFPGSGPPKAAATDPGNGALYLLTGGDGLVHRYLSDGAATPTYTEDPSFAMAPGAISSADDRIAVDPGTHEVLITDPSSPSTSVVNRFSPSGALVSTFDGADTAVGPLAYASSIAVGPGGDVYVIDHQTPARLERFNRAGASLGRVATAAEPWSVAVNQGTGQVFVSENLDSPFTPVGRRPLLEGFTAAGTQTFLARYPVDATGVTDRGLAVNSATDRVYSATEANFVAASVSVFAPTTQPGVDAPQVSQVGTTTAHVSAAIAPGGVLTDAQVEYCPVTAACDDFRFSDPGDPTNPWQVVQPPLDHQGLTSDTTIQDDLTGLEPNLGYRVRAYAKNASVDNVSASTTFTTHSAAPVVATGQASDVDEDGAVLNGKVDPRGAQTTYHFEFGTTTAYGARSPQTSEAVAGNGRTLRSFARTVAGLTPATTYHFRLVAENEAGTTFGDDQSFTTAAATEPTRAYEQVTPADKAGGVVSTAGFQAKGDGSAIEYPLSAAAQGAPSALQNPRMMSRRGTSDWADWDFLDPPIGVTRTIVSSATLAVSSDFTHVLVGTNRKLTAEATEGAGNLYIKDVATGAYTFVGSSNVSGAVSAVIGSLSWDMFLAGAPDFSWLVISPTVPLLPGVPNHAVYRWTAQGGLTVASRRPNGDVPTGQVAQSFGGASVRYVSDDGSVAYFAMASGETGVYRRGAGQTTAISVSRIPGDPATPQPGRVAGASRDGDAVVFVSGRLLAAAPAGNDNLYRYQASTDALTYLGTMAAPPTEVMGVSDDAQTVYFFDNSNTVVWHDGALHTVTAENPASTAFTSPNGRFLAWVNSAGDMQRYDAVADSTICVSCRSDGSPGGNVSLPLTNRLLSNRRPIVVNDRGAVFFTTSTRLTTADRNGSRDVYTYQGGRSTLVSPGTGAFNADYADSSEDGNDVFFMTGQGLVGQDVDDASDIYDARVGGGFPSQSPTAQASCQKSACGPTSSGPVTSPPVGGAPQPTGPPKTRTNQVKAKVSLRKVTFTAKAMHLTFTASQKGRVRVTGSRVATTVRDVSKAGTYSMTISLSKKARALRRAHRRFKVTAKVVLAGGWGTASMKINRTLRG